MAAGLLAKGPPVEAKWVFFIRIAIIVFSLVTLALSAWAVAVLVTPYNPTTSVVPSSSKTGGSSGCVVYGYNICKRFVETGTLARRQLGYATSAYVGEATSAPALSIFASAFTLITFGAVLAVEKASPQSYLRICVFIAYILAAIFVLSGWAYMASGAAAVVPIAQLYSKLPNADKQPFVQLASAAAASAAMGAVLWVLIIIATVMFALGSLRTEGASMGSGGTELNTVPVTQKGGEIQVTTQPAPAPVYQGYAAPPTQQQQVYAVPQQGFVQPQVYQQQQYVQQ